MDLSNIIAVAQGRCIYNKVEIAGYCDAQIEKYYQEGLQLLNEVDVDDARKENLRIFVHHLMERKL
jgi:geranylgeranyl diphosphate synthase type II